MKFFLLTLLILLGLIWSDVNVNVNVNVSAQPPPSFRCPIESAWNSTIPTFSPNFTEWSIIRLVRAPYCIVIGSVTYSQNLTSIFAVQLSDGKILWSHGLFGIDFINSLMISYDEGRIYFGENYQNGTAQCAVLVSRSLITGDAVWRHIYCTPTATLLYNANIVVLPRRNIRENSDFIVLLTFHYEISSNTSFTIIQVLDNIGRSTDLIRTNYTVTIAEAISSGRDGFFYILHWNPTVPPIEHPPPLTIWHVSRFGELSPRWTDNHYIPPLISATAPLMLHSYEDPNHWSGVSEEDEREHLWNSNRFGRVFLSPDWPTGSGTGGEPAEYFSLTPPRWSFEPHRYGHTLQLARRLINGTMLHEGFAIYNSFTGQQVARSDIMVYNEFFPPSATSTLDKSSIPTRFFPTKLLTFSVSQPPICRPNDNNGYLTLSVLDDYGFGVLIWQLGNHLHILDENTLETIWIRPLPELRFQCPNIIPINADGGAIAHATEHSDWLIGIPGDGLIGKENDSKQSE